MQETARRVAQTKPQLRKLANVGGLTTPDPSLPWASWRSPEILQTSTHAVHIAVDDLNQAFPDRGARLVMEDEEGVVGYPTYEAMQELSTRCGYPMDFVSKLPLSLQAEVINDRIRAEKNLPYTFTRQPLVVAEGEGSAPVEHPYLRTVTAASPGWRGILSHTDVAQTAWGIMNDVYGEGVSVRAAQVVDGMLKARLVTNYSLEVREGGRAVGDVLALGLDVWHKYGVELGVSLFVERLVCLNGMVTSKSEFEWKSVAMGTPEHQLSWLMVGVANAVSAFEDVVARARRMSAATIVGDPRFALIERARAMRLPTRLHDPLLAAYQQEQDPTEWGMLNAFTRLATHGDVPDSRRSAMMEAAGNWVEGFDMVTARLPRALATSSGAHIIDVESVEVD